MTSRSARPEIDLHLGDGIAGMRSLEPSSVDLVLTDLPSGQTRAEFDVPIDLGEFWAAVRHAAKPCAAVVIFASCMRFAAEVVASNSAEFRYDLVWRKNRASGFLNASRMPLRAHELILVFYQRLPSYRPQKTSGHAPVNAFSTRSGGSNYGVADKRRRGGGSTERYPTSVLDFDIAAPTSRSSASQLPAATSVLDFDVVPNVGASRIHPQQKPAALLTWIIESFTKEGDLVVDPCAGSGSAGRAATASGRRFIGWDLLEFG